jgi:hypothetical protein
MILYIVSSVNRTSTGRNHGMRWTGDLDAFDRAGVETQDVAAFRRALEIVPRDRWDVVELRLRVRLDAVQLTPGDSFVVSEDLIRRADALEGKKRALREENAARGAGGVRPT